MTMMREAITTALESNQRTLEYILGEQSMLTQYVPPPEFEETLERYADDILRVAVARSGEGVRWNIWLLPERADSRLSIELVRRVPEVGGFQKSASLIEKGQTLYSKGPLEVTIFGYLTPGCQLVEETVPMKRFRVVCNGEEQA